MTRNPLSNEFISIDDLYVAYRKAKQESYVETSNINAIEFAEYEKKIDINISNLFDKLVNNSECWWEDVNFLGDYLYIPKSLDEELWSKSETVHFRSVNPSSDWENRYNDSRRKLPAEYRLIIQPTVNYQIISALWILKVGHKFEGKLDNKLSYGNRLRRIKSMGSDVTEDLYVPNLDVVGLFQPYFTAYKKWRENGLNTMRTLVNRGVEVTAITMDLASFYHNVSPKFILRPSFLSTINVSLNKVETSFTKRFIDSIDCWYKSTPDFITRPEGALPVGLSASKIISNILLFELDKQLNNGLSPAYYGRYVDDIFLVFESDGTDISGKKVLARIRDKIDAITISYSNNSKPSLRLNFNYAKDSNLEFKSEKQKIFSLSSKHGLDLINQISDQIRSQSSEYRLLPEVPKSAGLMAEKTLLASSDASLVPDALRKADCISLKRHSFSILIRNVQHYTSNLSPNDWIDIREEFYGLVTRYLLTPKGIFEFFSFIPKIYRIIIENQDYHQAEMFIDKLNDCLELIKKTTIIKGRYLIKLTLFKKFLFKSLLEVSVQSATSKSTTQIDELVDNICKLYDFGNVNNKHITKRYLLELQEDLLVSDLGVRAYKDYWRDNNSRNNPLFSEYTHLNESVIKHLRLKEIEKFIFATGRSRAHWKPFVFPTRPLTVSEIALACPATLDDKDLLSTFILALRGAKVISCLDIGYDLTEQCNVRIPDVQKREVYIALTNFKVTDEQFLGSINSNPDLSLERYEKINNVINAILRSNKKIGYVVFPECSLPKKWALDIANKLSINNISLICGIEYYKNDNNEFRNDCLISLTTNWPGYNTGFLFMQPKCFPAHSEQSQLYKLGLSLYKPKSMKEMLPVYKHGEFHFGVLICSDLTNIANRLHFQGKVDALFVLAWNKDINTFNFLIESAAHDIHTHVIQVNNRAYGDSRVRVPANKSHNRDLVRLKGGVEDYFVIAEIDYTSLRNFHNNDEGNYFKPKPIGFQCSSSRKYKTIEEKELK